MFKLKVMKNNFYFFFLLIFSFCCNFSYANIDKDKDNERNKQNEEKITYFYVDKVMDIFEIPLEKRRR